MKIELDSFYGYPFAMEVVNGEIVSMTARFQRRVRVALKNKLGITDKELKSVLSGEDNPYELLQEYDSDVLAKLLGFDGERYSDEGIDFLGCHYGWEAKSLLESLGFKMKEKMEYGPHGHGTYGVYYIYHLK